MGYDGQVPFAPPGADPTRELQSVQQRYADFVAAGSSAYPSMFEGPLVYNSGGSRTYHYYTDELDTPVNEVAMGSAFFYPSDFSNIPEKDLRHATLLATPVLKRIDPAEAPFAPGFLSVRGLPFLSLCALYLLIGLIASTEWARLRA